MCVIAMRLLGRIVCSLKHANMRLHVCACVCVCGVAAQFVVGMSSICFPHLGCWKIVVIQTKYTKSIMHSAFALSDR